LGGPGRRCDCDPMSDQLRPGREVTGLIERIRRLVAEQRRGGGRGGRELREARRVEIARLQRRLAIAVKRELSPET
jgi:hypothetical protein